MIEKVVSGGQTGVDRAALDVAMDIGLPVAGWCPKGRRALDGPIPPAYPLTETPSRSYHVRTRWNVRDSDGTLIVCRGKPTGGTALTIRFCETLGKPFFVLRLESAELSGDQLKHWLIENRIRVLNVAGPRELEQHSVYADAREFLTGFLISSAVRDRS